MDLLTTGDAGEIEKIDEAKSSGRSGCLRGVKPIGACTKDEHVGQGRSKDCFVDLDERRMPVPFQKRHASHVARSIRL